MKKTLSVFLAVLLMVTALPLSSFSIIADAATVESGKTGDCTWKLKGTELTISGKGEMEKYGYYNWEDNIQPWGNKITKLIIENGVTSICYGAFENCTNLASISLPKSLTSISTKAFSNCDSLTSFTLPKNVTYLGCAAFEYCNGLTSLNVEKGNKRYKSVNNCIIDTEYKELLVASNTSVIPVDGSATEICVGAFSDRNIKKVYVPGCIGLIPFNTFNGSSLEKIVLGDGVKTLAVYGPETNLKKLETIVLPTSLKYVDWGIFQYCENLKTVYYTGTKNQWGKIQIEIGNDPLTKAKIVYNYTCKGSHNYKVAAKKASLSKNGKATKLCMNCGAYKTTVTYSPKTFKLASSSYTCNGKEKTPAVTVKDSAGKVIPSKYYTVTYSKGRKNVGKYNVIITFKGQYYSGSKTLSFVINPPKTNLATITGGKKQFKVNWTKKTGQTSGYQVQYSTNSNFKNAKTTTVSGNKITSSTVKRLTAKTKYFVRVRTYKTLGGSRYYSGWSATKNVTTK